MEMRDGIEQTDGTCTWVLQHSQYKDWIQKGGVLWIKGRPGTGKSTLMQHALRHSQQQRDQAAMLIGSFFFHRRGTELQYTHLRSLLHQILRADEKFLDQFCKESKFEEKCKNEGKAGKQWHWIESDLWTSLERYVQAFLKNRSIRLYVDALDEAGEKVFRHVISDLQRLAENENKDNRQLSVCFSCRPYPIVVKAYDFLIDIASNNE